MCKVLFLIDPESCGLIAGGEKTILISKDKLQIQTPFTGYIYCTESESTVIYGDKSSYVTDRLNILNKKSSKSFEQTSGMYRWNGKIIGEITCNKVFPIRVFENGTIQDWNFNELQKSCLEYDDISKYIGLDKNGYGFNITNLIVYNKPQQLTEIDNFNFNDGIKVR